MSQTKIIKIKRNGAWNKHWDGVEIIMSDSSKNIICKIDNYPECAEKFGIITYKSNTKSMPLQDNINKVLIESQDDFDDFIGAVYNDVSILKAKNEVTVEISTSKGVLYCWVYNTHFSYYTHEAFFKTEYGSYYQDI